MKKTIFILSFLSPLISLAQDLDYLHPAHDNSTLYGWMIGFYIFACIIVAAVADARGWDGLAVFAASLFCSPLIAAILYSPYKVKKIEGVKDDAAPLDNPIVVVKE